MEQVENLAPICLFVYCRLEELKLTVKSLQNNRLATESQLFIFLDGPANLDDNHKVGEVKEFIHTINGFAKVTIYESEVNKGLANSIISGVSKMLKKFETVIVLEDDLILATNFLCFMNQALNYYADKKRILSISGYAFNLKYPDNYNYDVALSIRASSWGWATWKDRWFVIDWELSDYSSFKWNLIKQYYFNRGGSDLSHMLSRRIKGLIDSWAIRFVYHQYKHNYLDVFPIVSKVVNNGFSSEATHTKFRSERFETLLDVSEQYAFTFLDTIEEDKSITNQFYHHYSLSNRIKDKLLHMLWKIKK